jgi:hypothetical protein
MKMGKTIPNISLPPAGEFCRLLSGELPPCARPGQCYALKAWKRPKVKAAWTRNGELLLRDPAKYWEELREFLGTKKPAWFRVHVGGDVPSEEYAAEIVATARSFPDTRFLCFTKKGALQMWADLPGNLSVVVSAWPGLEMVNPHGLPVAWMQDPKNPDFRIPSNAIPCAGFCESCGMCFSLRELGRDVVFQKH